MRKSIFYLLVVNLLLVVSLESQAQLTIDRSQTFGNENGELFYDAAPTDDGGLVVIGVNFGKGNMVSCGSTDGSSRSWLVKLDSQWNVQWQQCYGGTGDDRLQWIQPDGQGGWVMLGNVKTGNSVASCFHGVQDLWLVHVDSMGNVLEQRCYGGSKFDWPNYFRKTDDGGYLVAGASLSQDGDLDSSGHISTFREDAWMFKLDSSFDIVWSTIWGGTSFDEAHATTEHPNGGYLAVTTSSSDDGDVGSNYGKDDAWLLRLDDTGRVVWKKHYGGNETEVLTQLVMEADSVIYMAGTSRSGFCQWGNDDFWVIKADTSGNIIWEKCYGGTNIEELSSLKLHSGDILLIGTSRSEDGDFDKNYGLEDVWSVMLNSKGKIMQQRVSGGSGGDYNYGTQITYNKIISTGQTYSQDHDISDYHGGTSDAWLLQLIHSPTGTKEVAQNPGISLRYDDQNSQLVIEGKSRTHFSVLIYDLRGIPVLADTIGEPKEIPTIDLHHLRQGFYIATLLDENNKPIATKKFFKP